MSDISANDAGVASDAPVSDAGSEAFDLDAAVEEFASTAPDEWKGKASKIQSELKNLRSKYTPYRDRFESLHEGDRDAIMQLADLVKAGDRDASSKWLLEAAKGLSGDKFNELVQGLTPAQQEDLADQMEADAADEAGYLDEDNIQDMIKKAIAEDRAARDQEVQNRERQTKINNDFQALGYNTERDANGRLTDFTTQQVAMLAINDHGGDIAKAHDAYQKWLGDQAKSYLQKHQGDPTLVAEKGTPVTTADQDNSKLTPAQKAQERIRRLVDGAEA